MKLMRSVILIINTILVICLLTGCWSYREINHIYIVSCLAIDIDPASNNYLLSAEVADFATTGKETNLVSKIIQAEGKTLYEAIRSMTSTTPKELYWGHALVYIVSESVAKKGIIQILDWLTRYPETRSEAIVFVSKDATAKEILMNASSSPRPVGYDIFFSVHEQKKISDALKIEVYKILSILNDKGISAVVPVISSENSNSGIAYDIAGSAVFKKDKLLGYIDDEETKYLLFILNKIKSSSLSLKDFTDEPQPNISLRILSSHTKLMSDAIGDQLVIEIDIKADASLVEFGASNVELNKTDLKKIAESAEKSLEKDISKLIKRVQSDFGVDIFGFGKVVEREMPDYWQSVSANWDESFKNLKVNVKAEIDIINTGLKLKNVKVGD